MAKFLIAIAFVFIFNSASFAQKGCIEDFCTFNNAKSIKSISDIVHSNIFQGSRYTSNTNSTDSVITEQPKGLLYKNMYRTATCYELFLGGAVFGKLVMDGYATDVVEGSDGFLYLKDPFSQLDLGTWIKGEINDSTVIFKLPQKVKEVNKDGNVINLYAQAMKVKKDSTGLDLSGDDKIKYIWKNGILSKRDSDVVLGITYEDGSWLGYGDETAELFSVTDKILGNPQDLSKAQDFSLIYTDVNDVESMTFVKVVKEGDGIFIGGLDPTFKDGWIKGTLNNNIVTFDKQYIGYNPEKRYHSYFIPLSFVSDGQNKTKIKFLDKIDFNFDNVTGTMNTKSGACTNVGKNYPSTSFYFKTAQLSPFVDRSVVPSEPEILDITPYKEDEKWGSIDFNIPLFGIDGSVLNTNKMYFKIYFDGEPYTFKPDLYKGIKEDLTEIPYSFTDNMDFMTKGKFHRVYFYDKKFYTIGVQSIYKGGGGSKTSQIITKDVSGILDETNSSNNKIVKSVLYFDLSGRAISNPREGFFIKKVLYSDGMERKEKILF